MKAIVKLGGSIITEKSVLMKPNKEIIERLARELAEIESGVIVHGGGSFGHIKATRYGFKSGCESRKFFTEIHIDMIKLNEIVASSLLEAGLNVISIPPHTFYPFGNLSSIKYYIENGFIPITYGDVYWKDGKGWVISGDTLMLMLAEELKPELAIFVSNVDGIYTDLESGTPLKMITPAELTKLNIRDVDDATGGLNQKLKIMFKIASLGIRTLFINGLIENNLKNALTGKEFIGTVIKA